MADVPQDTPNAPDTSQSVDTLIADLRSLLSLPQDAPPEEILAAALDALQSAKGSDSAASDAPAAVANALGLPDTATGEQIVAAAAALRTGKDSVTQRLTDLEQRNQKLMTHLAESEADELILRYKSAGKLNEAMARTERTLLLAHTDAADFERAKKELMTRMESAPQVVPLGKTEPPDRVYAGGGRPHLDRAALICKTASEYDALDRAYRKITHKASFVDDTLRQLQQPTLTEDEIKTHHLAV